ncbi:hypothetical protein FS837_001983 [Tulasnella sp. UAMH 9824]|nr:hypothetical protein FS837_001983 [Tulasnella sp. UAMH 9824]
MSSNVVYSNAQIVNTPSHKKRPQHPSPVNSYRSAVERNGAMKRARWDVTSPTPSPPVLSVPLPPATSQKQSPAASGPPRRKFQFAATPQAFQFGFDSPTSSSTTTSTSPLHGSHRVSRTKRHRASTTSSFAGGSPYTSYSRPSTFPYRQRVSPVHTQVVDPDDEPFFALAGNDARTASTMDTAFAFERLRRSTFDEGESFVNKMREWEHERSTQQGQAPSSHHQQLRTPDAGKMGGLFGGRDHQQQQHEDANGAMYSAASASYSSSSPPYMSNSISSNSSTATSGSGSDGGIFAFGLSAGSSLQRPTLEGVRKRSWSIVEEDDTTSACDAGEMDWEVVASAQRPPVGLRSNPTLGAESMHGQVHIQDDSLCFSPSIEAVVPGTETAEDGDDEQEDSSSSIEDDSDDDLIFVIGNNMPGGAPAESAGRSVGASEPSAVSAERMIAELSQVFAAGGADLEDHGVESEAFFELELGGDNAVAAHGPDAGALWQ